jgi:uncharacterized protein YjbJ (UPF0337 family)
MKLTEVKGNWKKQKGLLMQKIAVLTQNNLMFTKGKEEKLLGRLQIKLGKSKNTLDNANASL